MELKNRCVITKKLLKEFLLQIFLRRWFSVFYACLCALVMLMSVRSNDDVSVFSRVISGTYPIILFIICIFFWYNRMCKTVFKGESQNETSERLTTFGEHSITLAAGNGQILREYKYTAVIKMKKSKNLISLNMNDKSNMYVLLDRQGFIDATEEDFYSFFHSALNANRPAAGVKKSLK